MQADNLPGVVVGIWIPGKGELFLAKGKANIETGASRNVDGPFRSPVSPRHSPLADLKSYAKAL